MADPVVVLAKKAKTEEIKTEVNGTGYDLDAYFAKSRPDKSSRCTWTKDSRLISPHIHNDNM